MNTHSSFNSTRNTAVAALVGVAAAAVVKMLLDEAVATPFLQNAAPSRHDKYELMREAAYDPQYLADMQQVQDDFAFADAETL